MRLAWLLLMANCSGAARSAPPPEATPTPEENPMTRDGKTHPGTIAFVDKVDDREWTREVRELPETMAWAEVDGGWAAVVRIEITGEPGHRRTTRFGADGAMLDSTVQKPRPPRRSTPTPIPTPK